jgi:hypothetical protein
MSNSTPLHTTLGGTHGTHKGHRQGSNLRPVDAPRQPQAATTHTHGAHSGAGLLLVGAPPVVGALGRPPPGVLPPRGMELLCRPRHCHVGQWARFLPGREGRQRPHTPCGSGRKKEGCRPLQQGYLLEPRPSRPSSLTTYVITHPPTHPTHTWSLWLSATSHKPLLQCRCEQWPRRLVAGPPLQGSVCITVNGAGQQAKGGGCVSVRCRGPEKLTYTPNDRENTHNSGHAQQET